MSNGRHAFTKQHYIAIAKIIRDSGAKGKVKASLCDEFAQLFAQDNERFDRGRWDLAVIGWELIERPG